MSATTLGMCSECGTRPADKISSGSPECWNCWSIRKLDLPAAQHWARVAEEFLSNVDFHDLTAYLPSCGMTKEEMTTMITCAKKVRDHSKALVDNPWAHEAAHRVNDD